MPASACAASCWPLWLPSSAEQPLRSLPRGSRGGRPRRQRPCADAAVQLATRHRLSGAAAECNRLFKLVRVYGYRPSSACPASPPEGMCACKEDAKWNCCNGLYVMPAVPAILPAHSFAPFLPPCRELYIQESKQQKGLNCGGLSRWVSERLQKCCYNKILFTQVRLQPSRGRVQKVHRRGVHNNKRHNRSRSRLECGLRTMRLGS